MGKMSDMLGKEKAQQLLEKMRGGLQYQEEFLEKLYAQYKWYGLPKGVGSKYFEYNLVNNDNVCLAVAKNGNYKDKLVCFSPSTVNLNVYNEPVKVYGHLRDGTCVETEDFVMCYDRTGSITSRMIIDWYCNQLEEIDKTIQSNLKFQRKPYIISAKEGQKLTYQVIMNNVNEGVEVIYVKDDFDQSKIGVLNLTVPYVVDKLEEHKRMIRSDCLTALGINNVNVIKKERLVSGETDANNEDIFLSKNSRTREREEFCERYKEVFGSKFGECPRFVEPFLEISKGGSKNE